MEAEQSLIEVKSLSKIYSRSGADSRRRAGVSFVRALMGLKTARTGSLRGREFWALNDVNFSLAKGEALGIIGLNGSGKTTLLRLLAGQMPPDLGEIRIAGSTVSLIDLTAGFRMSATGRENIFLKGAMLGRTRKDMLDACDSIIEFSELEDAIDSPISTYSAGMTMRLAFAINMVSKAEVLLIDETLAVGDFKFRQKCLAQLREIREDSCFVLVSHAMDDIKRFCTRAVVMHQGEVVFQGAPRDAIEFYEGIGEGAVPEFANPESILGPWIHNVDAVQELEHYWCNEDGEKIEQIEIDEKLCFRISFRLSSDRTGLVMGIPLFSQDGQLVTGFSTEKGDVQIDAKAGEKVSFTLEVPNLQLTPGVYISNFGLMDGPEFLVRLPNPSIEVKKALQPHWGVVTLSYHWR